MTARPGKLSELLSFYGLSELSHLFKIDDPAIGFKLRHGEGGFWNQVCPARIGARWGVPPVIREGEIMGRDISMLHHPDEDMQQVYENISKQTKQLTPHFYLHMTKQGKQIPVEFCTSRITYNGKPVQFSNIRDITERKRFQEVLREGERKFQRLDTIRHQIIQRDGRFSWPQGKLTLTMSSNRAVKKDLLRFMDALQKAV